MTAGEVYRLACRVRDTALTQGVARHDPAVPNEEYMALREEANDALKALADVIYEHFPLDEEREAAP